ncbi:MAG: thioredoxin family protein [Candidatus Paceibacterota bacterium]
MIKLINCRILILSFLLSFPISALAQEAETVPITLEEALKRAPLEGKKILLDVYASWCPYCQRMHSDVYTSDEVIEAISSYYLWVKINVESDELVNYHGEEMTEAEFAQALENKNIPTTYFLNDEGAIIGVQPGFLDVDVFSNLLNFVGSDASIYQSFDDYLNQD